MVELVDTLSLGLSLLKGKGSNPFQDKLNFYGEIW